MLPNVPNEYRDSNANNNAHDILDAKASIPDDCRSTPSPVSTQEESPPPVSPTIPQQCMPRRYTRFSKTPSRYQDFVKS